jgi:hypothetical protein
MVKPQRLAPLLVVGGMFAALASTAACAAIFGFEELSVDGADPLSPEGSTEAGDTAPPFEAGASCTALGLPSRPAPSDAGADGPEPINMAVKLFDFGIDTKIAPAGFNLDRVCSPGVAQGSCATKENEATFAKYARDLDDKGTDNAGYGLITYLSYLGDAFRPAEINQRLADGEFGIVLRLASWNGTPEDDDVLVEVFPAIGVALDPDAGVPVTGGKPAFVAADTWMRDRRFQNIVDASRIRSASAFVTGGKLVASFDSVTLPITVPSDKKPLDIVVREGFLYASLVPDGASWKLEKGVLAGRWRTADILAQVRTIYIKDTIGLKNVYICDPNLPIPVYTAVKKEVCDGRDLRASSREDNKGLPCEAVSAGIRFDSYALDTPGPFADLPVVPARCQQDGSVPEGDDCAPAAP